MRGMDAATAISTSRWFGESGGAPEEFILVDHAIFIEVPCLYHFHNLLVRHVFPQLVRDLWGVSENAPVCACRCRCVCVSV